MSAKNNLQDTRDTIHDIEANERAAYRLTGWIRKKGNFHKINRPCQHKEKIRPFQRLSSKLEKTSKN